MTEHRYKKLLGVVSYDPETGIFRWKISPQHNVKIGEIAGYINQEGYCIIGFRRFYLKAHRVAFFAMTGRIPQAVDHIDGDKSNNAWGNLRECTWAENSQNSKLPKNNTSGLQGVTWHRRMGKWAASIRLNYKGIHLGYFDDKFEAYAAYLAAKAKHHPFAPVGCKLPFTDMLKTEPVKEEA